jgi:hypothetical protein
MVKFKDESFPSTTFEKFCDSNGLTVVVRERTGEFGHRRYFAMCNNVYVRESDGMLCGAMGNGASKNDAVRDYENTLAGRVIVVDAWGPSRRELQCPNVWKVV